MKKLFVTLLCMVASICASHAQQKIVGDMNDDGVLNIADLTLFVNTLLGKTAQKTVSASSDQTTLVGTWRKTDGSLIRISSEGKATMSTATVSTYDYNPTTGGLCFFNSSKKLVAAYQVESFSSSCLTLCASGSTTKLYYYPYSSYATSISMSESSASMSVGKTKQLSIVPSPAGARLYDATWISDNTSVATVSSSGLVTAKGVGSATIGAQLAGGGLRAFCTITVVKPVESLTLSQTSLTLPLKSTFTLDAIVNPSDASNKTLAWTSSNTSVATVSDGKITVGSTSGTTTITATTTDGTNLSATCTVNAKFASPTALTLSRTSATLAPKGTLKLSATIVPTTAKGLSVVWSSSDESIATVDQAGNVTAKTKGGTAYIRAKIAGTSITKSCAVTVEYEYEYVDLGLPSGTLWATMNVGAASPEEYGNYYAWGETKAYGEEDTSNTHNYSYNKNSDYTKKNYRWETYKWCSGDSNETLTKYNTKSDYGTVDNKTTLDLADDAAYVNWGTNWRMPTKDEMKELKENCTWTWTTMNGVNGYMVTSKKDTSKYIFLPAAGCRDDSSLDYDGGYGYYWSSSLGTDTPYFAWNLFFGSGIIKPGSGYDRCGGFSVRPVRRQ